MSDRYASRARSIDRRGRLADLVRGSHPVLFTWKGWTIAAAAIIAVIIPSLFLPLGPDEALFLVSGEKIVRGAAHYRDIIDIKPPLIYHLYALGVLLFGTGEMAIRIFDSLLQAATCALMIGVVRRATRNDLIAALSPILYLLLYIGQGYGAVGQAESYTGLFGMIILHLLLFRRSRGAFVAVGLLAGTLGLFKFTLGVIAPAALLAELIVPEIGLRERLRNCGWMMLGMAIAAGAFLLYLIATGGLANFLLVNRFLRGYAAIELGSLSAWFRNMLRGVAVHFSDNYSIALFLATTGGIGLSLLRARSGDGSRVLDDRSRLLRVATIMFLLLLASVLVEGKFYHYHFSRIYAFGGMLAAIGLVRSAGWIVTRGNERGFGAIAMALLAVLLLIFGPLPRYVWQCVPMITKLRGGDAALDRLYDRIGSYYPRSELRSIGRYIAERKGDGDRVFAGSSIAALVYYFAGHVPDASIYHSAFYMARFAPPEFREMTRGYLLNERPRFVVMQINDTTADISGVRDATSASALRALPGIDSLLEHDYGVVMRTKYFEVREIKYEIGKMK